MDLLTLALICGPMVNPAMTLRIIDVESAGHAYAIHDNTNRTNYDATTAAQAARVAETLISGGHRIDIGLMQINYEVWLKPTRFSIEMALDPCTNIRLGTTLLSANYAHALSASSTPADALAHALSVYNSGSESRALGYAEKVLKAHREPRAGATPFQRSAAAARVADVVFPNDAASR